MEDFTKLGLKKEILGILARLKYKKPFEVQEKVVPLTMQGKNVVFMSRTGSGKTLAYTLGMLGKLNRKLETQMLVIVPTRELAVQVGKEIKTLCELLNLNVGVLFGGRELSGDYKTTRKKNHVMVATPGRLIDHINAKRIIVGDVRYLVFDESDQMFDNGFYDACVYLKKRVSANSQIVLASATMTEKVEEFIVREIKDYEMLQIGEVIPKNIDQEKLFCDIIEKNEILVKFFKLRKFKRALVFCNTKVKSSGINKFLKDNGFNSSFMTGNLLQKERQDTLNLFKEGKIQILVTTDVAARGLHIESVDYVINYDIPTRAEFYVHRIGRTGRKNKKGYSLSFICPEDVDRFKILDHTYDLEVTEIDKEFQVVEQVPEPDIELEDEEDENWNE